MTVGIYCLTFEGTEKIYIGLSKHIEQRLREHLSSLKKGLSGRKLQEAYNTYGEPSLHILEECSESNLVSKEIEYISIFNSYYDGLNSTKGGDGVQGIYGEDTGMSIYTNEQVVECFALLCDVTVPYKYIEEYTGIDYSNICNISNGRSHKWLSIEFPKEYSEMISLKHLRASYTRSSKGLGKVHPPVLSPEGTVHTVTNIRLFSKEHNLTASALGHVLRGTRAVHKGWKLL